MTDLKSITNYYADYDISEPNILETAIEIDEVDMDIIIIDILVHFPFPEIAGVSVDAHDGLKDVALLDPEIEDNLSHYARRDNEIRSEV